jgi:hypothetical protein
MGATSIRNMGDVLGLISIVLWAVMAVAVLLGQKWLVARVEKGVQHRFDRKIEEVRSEFRDQEERLKSDLRMAETEIATLRNNVLSGSANRQALLDKRRFEAAEKVWAAVEAIQKYHGLSTFMAILKFEAVSAEADDPKMQQLLSVFKGLAPPGADVPHDPVQNEQLFVSGPVWAYYSAYRAVIMLAIAKYKVLTIGVKDAHQLISENHVRSILKTALPDRSKFIDENDSGASMICLINLHKICSLN